MTPSSLWLQIFQLWPLVDPWRLVAVKHEIYYGLSLGRHSIWRPFSIASNQHHTSSWLNSWQILPIRQQNSGNLPSLARLLVQSFSRGPLFGGHSSLLPSALESKKIQRFDCIYKWANVSRTQPFPLYVFSGSECSWNCRQGYPHGWM